MKTKQCYKCKKIKRIEEFRIHINKGKYQYYYSYCKSCAKVYYVENKEKLSRENKVRYHSHRKAEPWWVTFTSTKCRCKNTKRNWYKRGIKFLLSLEELKTLWFRDKAYLQKKPSIDRIDNDGNYEFSNCRYIEHSLNARLGNIRSQ